MDFLSYFAFFLLIFVILVLAYGIVAIHDIPYLIAKKRNHPHAETIHAGGWVSLFTLHAIWPFLWLWATAYHPEHGYLGEPRSDKAKESVAGAGNQDQIAQLEQRIAELEVIVARLETSKPE